MRQGSICAPHDRLSSFVGYDSKDGVVLIFLLSVFTLTSKRGGEVAGINFFQSFHSKENNFSLIFFPIRIFLKVPFSHVTYCGDHR